MPKSKRARVIHASSVTKKTREHKERLFENVRECIPQYQHCFVLTIDNMRNTYLKDVRQELSDSRFVFIFFFFFFFFFFFSFFLYPTLNLFNRNDH